MRSSGGKAVAVRPQEISPTKRRRQLSSSQFDGHVQNNQSVGLKTSDSGRNSRKTSGPRNSRKTSDSGRNKHSSSSDDEFIRSENRGDGTVDPKTPQRKARIQTSLMDYIRNNMKPLDRNAYQHELSCEFSSLHLSELSQRWFKTIFSCTGVDHAVYGSEDNFKRAVQLQLKMIDRQLKNEDRFICPNPIQNIWRWTKLIEPHDVKVVIVGQDPYHSEEQGISLADGLAFSVNPEYWKITKVLPPSLVNIFKSSGTDGSQTGGDLSDWCKQGVLLLNTVLTCVKGEANSHSAIGWQWLTDRVITNLAAEHYSRGGDRLVFMLWGNQAKSKEALIDKSSHIIIKTCHPSPLAAYRGDWFKEKCFQRANAYLTFLNKKPISW